MSVWNIHQNCQEATISQIMNLAKQIQAGPRLSTEFFPSIVLSRFLLPWKIVIRITLHYNPGFVQRGNEYPPNNSNNKQASLCQTHSRGLQQKATRTGKKGWRLGWGRKSILASFDQWNWMEWWLWRTFLAESRVSLWVECWIFLILENTHFPFEAHTLGPLPMSLSTGHGREQWEYLPLSHPDSLPLASLWPLGVRTNQGHNASWKNP